MILSWFAEGSQRCVCGQVGLERELHSARERLAEAGSAASGAHREAETFRRALELKDAEIGAANEGRRRAEAAAVGAQSTLEAVRMEHTGAVAERARLEAAVTAEKDNARRERESGEAARDKARREVEEARYEILTEI